MLAKDELVAILENCLEVVISSPAKLLGEAAEKLKEYLGRFRNLEGIYLEAISQFNLAFLPSHPHSHITISLNLENILSLWNTVIRIPKPKFW